MHGNFDKTNSDGIRVFGYYDMQINDLENTFTVTIDLNYQYLGPDNSYGFSPYACLWNKSIGYFYPNVQDYEIFSGDHITLRKNQTINCGTHSKTFNLQSDGTTNQTRARTGARGGEIELQALFYDSMSSGTIVNFGIIKSSNMHIKLNNIWKNVYAWMKKNNVWKRCIVWKKINGIWKKGS